MIARPRRFGKTLNMSMLEYFFSMEYAEQSHLFDGLNIYQEKKYKELQGTYPVIAVSFAMIKESSWEGCYKMFQQIFCAIYNHFSYILSSELLLENEKTEYRKIMCGTADEVESYQLDTATGREHYQLSLTNKEVYIMFENKKCYGTINKT